MMDANQVWGVDEAIAAMRVLARVRPVVDRGADEPRRRPRARAHPRGDRADPRRDRRARAEPGHLQAAAPGRRDRRSARSTPAASAGVNEVLAIMLMAAKFGVPVCPHAGGVGLCEYVQHLAVFDYVSVSGSLEDRVVEWVDHLHEHFRASGRGRRRALPRALRRPATASRCCPASLEEYALPDGPDLVRRPRRWSS